MTLNLSVKTSRNAGRLDALASYMATIASGHLLVFLHAAFSHEAVAFPAVDLSRGCRGSPHMSPASHCKSSMVWEAQIFCDSN